MELEYIRIFESNGKLWVKHSDMTKYVYQKDNIKGTMLFKKVMTIEMHKRFGNSFFEVGATINELRKAAQYTIYYPRKIELADYLQKKYDEFVLRNRKVEVSVEDIQNIIKFCNYIHSKLPDSSTEEHRMKLVIDFFKKLIRGAQNGN